MISVGVGVVMVVAPSGILILCPETLADDTDAVDAFNHSTMMRRLAYLSLTVLLLAGCVTRVAPPGPAIARPGETANAFIMPDGAVLPYREWLPSEPPRAVVLALHGMNDSRDAWEYPAPALVNAGIALFSPDLRGFGATSSRGLWPGTNGLASDARVMAQLLRARYPHTRLILMAESMGAAALMVLAGEPNPPPVDGYVLIAPAVWGRSEMSFLMRASLWLADSLVPGLTITGRGIIRVTASDNKEALHRLSTDPLTIHETRVDAIKGLVDLMDHALAAVPHFHAPALFLYGGHDELVPPRATAATWRALPKSAVLAFYPNGYHLLLRDKDREMPIGDVLSWIQDPKQPLPSGADKAALIWLATQKQEGIGPIHNPAAAP
jgi:alpha-beta hydrolase superfamily lysophospholipase